MNDHRARYKNSGLDSKELRRRREEDSIQLRKQKRDDVLSKRRTIEPALDLSVEDITSISHDQSVDVKDLVNTLAQSQDAQTLIATAKTLRKILSKEPQPPIDEVIASGAIPLLTRLLESNERELQFEVAWVLTNVASGSTQQTSTVVDSGAVKIFIGLLSSPYPEVREQAVWALGNIIGDGSEYRDMVIGWGFVPALMSLINKDMEIGFLRNATWVLVNLCRNKDPPTDIEVIKQILPALTLLLQLKDLPILIDTAWALSYITELGPDYVQLVLRSDLLKLTTPLLAHNEVKLQTAAIRALGSIVTGSDEQTQFVLDAGALLYLSELLKGGNSRIIKEGLWFASNITAGSPEQVQSVIDFEIIPFIIYYLDKGDASQQKEALWAIFNLCLSGTPKHLNYLYENDVIPPLCYILKSPDTLMVRNALETLNCLLQTCHKTNPDICEVIEACGGLDQIDILQQSEVEEIYNFAYSIVEQYFQNEDIQ